MKLIIKFCTRNLICFRLGPFLFPRRPFIWITEERNNYTIARAEFFPATLVRVRSIERRGSCFFRNTRHFFSINFSSSFLREFSSFRVFSLESCHFEYFSPESYHFEYFPPESCHFEFHVTLFISKFLQISSFSKVFSQISAKHLNKYWHEPHEIAKNSWKSQ